MVTESLEAYRPAFKAAVLQHVRGSLDAAEWARLRALSTNRQRFAGSEDGANGEATPETLFDVAVAEETISAAEVLIGPFKATAVEIERIEGQPVYYLEGRGVYFWGLEAGACRTLSFWVTHPAYPPGW